ncbi:MAG: DUF3604 domain-containing protein [Deltaproteobacteria bacterium]|nr:DUF3604 domain-containing protein [Deltaproteobacteria bacterium]
MGSRVLVVVGGLVAVLLVVLYVLGIGVLVSGPVAGTPEARAVSESVIDERAANLRAASIGIGVAKPKQILFGDLHVHSTFSFDAFQLSLPMAQGDGAHPIADACDYARHCSALDFWSINDHGIALTPERWAQTVETIRQCNEVAADSSNPDTVAYLGWEWTQVGWVPKDHWGHKNVILRDLDDDRIPARPITAGFPPGTPPLAETTPSPFLVGAMALYEFGSGGPELARYGAELAANVPCPSGVPVRDLPLDCQENAPTPDILFDKLDDWGHEAMVIPHGTTWGFYTPLGSSWDKQIAPGMHDPKRQRIIEVMSGHGNSEEYRPFEEVTFDADGTPHCPAPANNFLPSCWRAGEIIEARCQNDGESADECAERAEIARRNYVEAYRNAGANTVPGATLADWQDSGQCRDCFQPSFNYRPKSSVQYILALGRTGREDDSGRFRFGMIAASDNHSARPGTGYKEVARSEFTEARFGEMINTPLGYTKKSDPIAHSTKASTEFSTAIFSVFETERGSSFFLNGGLAAVHSNGRSREEIWDAMQRKEVYGTSGPRILLWFDLLNGPDGIPLPMGSDVELGEQPIFQVRAVGSFEQKPGCPPDAIGAMSEERVARLCQGECYNPSDTRRPITRIEVVRIQPQVSENEEIVGLVDDPWKIIPCPAGGEGCRVAFTDPEYEKLGRDVLYYVRAIEAPSPAVGADPLGCSYDETGRCVRIAPCSDRPYDDDCLAETEERAWSSPIFVDRPSPDSS